MRLKFVVFLMFRLFKVLELKKNLPNTHVCVNRLNLILFTLINDTCWKLICYITQWGYYYVKDE